MSTATFRVLGLKPSASRTEIREAYQRLARLHHPDRGGDPAEMARINRAYAILHPVLCTTCEGTGFVIIKRGAGSTKQPCKECR